MLSLKVIARHVSQKLLSKNPSVVGMVCNRCKRDCLVTSVLVCRTCVGRYCTGCSAMHVRSTGHALFGLCGIHDYALDRFCTRCKAVVCCACEAMLHFDEGDHHVIMYGDAVSKSKADLGEQVEIGDAAYLALLEQTNGVADLKHEARAQNQKLVGVIREKLGELDHKMCDFEIKNIKDTIQYHERQIRDMQNRLRAVEQRKLQGDRLVRIMKMLEKDIDDNIRKIGNVLEEMSDLQKKLRDLLLAKVSLLPAEMVLPAGLHKDVDDIKKELEGLSAEAEEDRLNPLKGILSKTTDFLNEGFIRFGRFSRTRLTCHLKLPCYDFEPCGFVFMSGGRIAACGKGEGRYSVWLWEVQAKSPKVLMTGNVPLVSLAVTEQEGLVVLRRADPVLCFIKVNSKQIKNIRIKPPIQAKKFSQIAMDDRGLLFVAYNRMSSNRVAVVDMRGFILEDVGVGNCDRMTFCSLRNCLLTCSPRDDVIKILRVRVSASRDRVEDWKGDDLILTNENRDFAPGGPKPSGDLDVARKGGALEEHLKKANETDVGPLAKNLINPESGQGMPDVGFTDADGDTSGLDCDSLGSDPLIGDNRLGEEEKFCDCFPVPESDDNPSLRSCKPLKEPVDISQSEDGLQLTKNLEGGNGKDTTCNATHEPTGERRGEVAMPSRENGDKHVGNRHEPIISETCSFAHSVQGFRCLGISAGSLGQVLVIGVMEGPEREFRVYQLDLDAHECGRMRRIETVGVRTVGGDPHISVRDNHLVLSDRSTVRVFTLKQ